MVYHLTKRFLPLFVIVAIAFTVFWIDADDLSSQVTIGVTCVLAAIAFQLAEAGSLPEVAYLTLADRVYAACYLAIGLAVMETVYTNGLARSGRKAESVRIDRFCRVGVPHRTGARVGRFCRQGVCLNGLNEGRDADLDRPGDRSTHFGARPGATRSSFVWRPRAAARRRTHRPRRPHLPPRFPAGQGIDATHHRASGARVRRWPR